MMIAHEAVERFQSVEGRKEMVMRVRVKCLGCRECVGLSGSGSGGDNVCVECYWFSRFNSWKSWSLIVAREDMLFEFC